MRSHVAELALSMSWLSCRYFHNGPSCRRETLTRWRLPRKGCRPFTREVRHLLVPSHSPLISSVTYRLALPLPAGAGNGRSRTFTGQCCQPFCPGGPTSHSDGPRVVTKYQPVEERIGLLRLRPAWERGPPSEPNRDTSRTIFTWPLRHRSLPPGAGCIPLLGSSEDFRTGLDPPG